jgi:hypothetical protein
VSDRAPFTGAQRGGLTTTVRQMVSCVAQAEHPAGLHTGQSNLPNRLVRDPYARWCGDCALKAHEVQLSEMAAAVKSSQQLCTESCVVAGNGPCEA